jgi:toxin ParE1/3/4
MSVVWRVRLAAQAELDFSEIITWTLENFGDQQAETYAETLTLAIAALHDGPEQLGAKARDDIQAGIRTLHVARHGRAGRHFVVFTQANDQHIDVLRVLHDSMDLARHIPAVNEPTRDL